MGTQRESVCETGSIVSRYDQLSQLSNREIPLLISFALWSADLNNLQCSHAVNLP